MMASIEEKPLKEHEEGDQDRTDEYEEAVSSGGCCCLGLLGFRWGSQSNYESESKNLLHINKGERRETWGMKQLIKVKQATEVVAGPKWKTFLRKISASCGNHKNNKKHSTGGFQYDPRAYALNFDEGFDGEEDGVVLDFRSRFAPTPPPS